ncbi:hypothetical protein lacNasYZ03_03860 [Lactobacillus nasalidis]|uniref:Uncharacterized protein n=2 Tax=Lactobacillus nasalidis TaxID=2797258 RepID=A0ABQ3W6I2_9LACO|nr:hypothetical protein lacNasYZ03_03860 [Lactobacillus nasalidis]
MNACLIDRQNLPDLLAKQEIKAQADEDYLISPSTVAVYDFQMCPLLGRYRTIAYDAESGWILLEKKTCRRLVHQLRKQEPAHELTIKKQLCQQLGMSDQYVQSFGSHAYFSFFIIRHKPLDLVALHQMKLFECAGNRGLFLTLDRRYCFGLDMPKQSGRGQQILQDCITHNAAFLQLAAARAASWGCRLKPVKRKSLLNDPAYVRESRLEEIKALGAQQILAAAEDHYLNYCSEEFLKEFSAWNWNKQDMRQLLNYCSKSFNEIK